MLRTEKEGERFRVRRLANYGPRAFASIEGLEDTLASRTVQITMQRSCDNDINRREVNLNDPVFQEIRDELFLVAMTAATWSKRFTGNGHARGRGNLVTGSSTCSGLFSRLDWPSD